MNKQSSDFDLLRLFDALRPKDYQARIINPAGELTHDAKFATKADAVAWGKANRQSADVVMTRYVESCSKN